jgi:cytochrome c oxidase assembly protein subunit 15
MICNKFNFKNKSQNIKNKYNIVPIIAALILLAMVFCQIFIGGLVAGSKAGFVYNTFPRMDGRLIPPEIWELNFKIESLSNILYIQFIHRAMACIIGLFSIIYSFYMIYIYRKNNAIVISNLLLSLSIFCQIIFGILTLLHVVPLGLALFHQFFSIIVLSIIIWNIYIIRYSMKSIDSEI